MIRRFCKPAASHPGSASALLPLLRLALVASLTVVPGELRAAERQSSRQLRDVGGMTELKSMLLKYVARCALDAGQGLAGPDAGVADRSFPGLIGLAPEWLSGKCGADCQERVSACLLAFVNRTGKHVEISLTSAAPSMIGKLVPNAQDKPYPHQEGAFFGNMWTGKAFACRGAQSRKGPQVKRFCAADPASCSSELATFVDAGRCVDVCQMRCFAIDRAEQRCAAVSCRDPAGVVWQHPITTLVRNKMEAANADQVSAALITDSGLRPQNASARATFEAIDFGTDSRKPRTFVLTFDGAAPGAEVEVWLGDERMLGAARATASAAGIQRLRISLGPSPLVGAHPIVLRLRGGASLGQLNEIELI
jgi:hypothetical protein